MLEGKNRYFSEGEHAVLTLLPNGSVKLEDSVELKNAGDDRPKTQEEQDFFEQLKATGAMVSIPKSQAQWKVSIGLGSSRAGQGENLSCAEQEGMEPQAIEAEKDRRAIENLREILRATIKHFLEHAVEANTIPNYLGSKEKPFFEIDEARAAEITRQIQSRISVALEVQSVAN